MENKIEDLKKLGYSPVWVYSAMPNEDDPDHAHQYDTHLFILEGEISIKMNGKVVILKPGDKIDIPREKVHAGKAGAAGCKYIVAEKH